MERNIAYVALFAALLAILSLLPAVTLPGGVPITAQTLGVMLCGVVLGGRLGALAVALYVGLALIGLPILPGGRGGLGVLGGPTAGFLLGFVPGAFVTGLIFSRLRMQTGLAAFAAALLGGVGVVYACGLPWMAAVLGKSLPQTLALLTPFLPGDLLKAALAALVAQGLAKARPEALISRG